MHQLTNRESADIVRRLLISAPTDPDLFSKNMDELVERCHNDDDNWMSVFSCMGGVLTGLLLSVAEHEQMNIKTVVNDLFNDDYAAMLDMNETIEREHDAAGTTDTSQGTDFVDRSLGDREVDGLGDSQ